MIAVTAALYFADRNMKTDDNHFVGFPAVWNLIAFYLLLLKPVRLDHHRDDRSLRGSDVSCRSASCIRFGCDGCAP